MCMPQLVKCPQEDLFGRADNLQQGKEDLDNVGIDSKSAEHILLWADGILPVSYQKLCVVCQELEQEQEKKLCKNAHHGWHDEVTLKSWKIKKKYSP